MIFIYKKTLSPKKKISIALTSIYGLNKKTSIDICLKLGINSSTTLLGKKFEISQEIKKYILNNLTVENKLKMQLIETKKHLRTIKLIRGLRNTQGLPVRGQRTHTNGKTKKKYKIK